MRRFAFLAVLALAFATPAHADDPTDVLAAGKAFDAAQEKRDCATGAPIAARLSASPSLDTLSDARRLSIWAFGANCAVKAANLQLALEDARHGTELPDAPDWLWRLRVLASIALNRPDDAADAVETLVHVRPAVVSSLDAIRLSEFVGDLVVRLHRPDIASRVLGALEAANYQAPGAEGADRLWVDFALTELEAGHNDHARALMERVTRSRYLMSSRLDARFRNIVAENPQHFDVMAATNGGIGG